MLKERDWTCSQREEHLMHVDTICPWVSLGITGRIWWKSSQKQNITPSNDRRFLWIFFIIQLTTSNVYRCCIDISSQNINWISYRNLIRWLWMRILHVESTWMSMRILKWEWVVVSSSSRVTTTSEEIVDNAISSSIRIFVNNKLIKKVFLMPSNPWRKKTSSALDVIASQSASKAFL